MEIYDWGCNAQKNKPSQDHASIQIHMYLNLNICLMS